MPSVLSPLAAAYELVLLDLDGTLWVGEHVVPGGPKAVAALRAAGVRVGFVTNDARHSTEELVRKLWRLGYQASIAEVVTVGGALQFALAEAYPGRGTAFVIGAPAIHRHVADAGLRIVNDTDLGSRAEVVVVAGHHRFDYAELRTATQAALRGAELWSTGRDRTFPEEDGAQPGTGAIVAAVEYASNRVATSVGKPEPGLFRAALDRFGAGRTLVIGDRVDADIAGAHAAGLDAALVLTGASDRAAAAGCDPAPVLIADDLPAAVLR